MDGSQLHLNNYKGKMMIMTEIDVEGRIFHELEIIKSELKDIKEHMVDADTILSEEERMLIEESFKHEKEGKLVSLSEFKKEIVT
jgi:hypothetical protein